MRPFLHTYHIDNKTLIYFLIIRANALLLWKYVSYFRKYTFTLDMAAVSFVMLQYLSNSVFIQAQNKVSRTRNLKTSYG